MCRNETLYFTNQLLRSGIDLGLQADSGIQTVAAATLADRTLWRANAPKA
jgi:hypothetical protein